MSTIEDYFISKRFFVMQRALYKAHHGFSVTALLKITPLSNPVKCRPTFSCVIYIVYLTHRCNNVRKHFGVLLSYIVRAIPEQPRTKQ